MAKLPLTGSRIRERRLDLGLRQAALAEACGISASYLNLIEHNRRRIGGKLLNNLAAALEVEPTSLSEGADIALLGALREAAEAAALNAADAARAEELAGRFPGWAELIAAQARRIASLERTVGTLSDRLAHDPHLSEALHDLLSTVTAIRSASSILAGEEEVDPEWQARFLRNINEDSHRLVTASEALVRYLDAETAADGARATPQEDLEAWLSAEGWHLADLERALPPSAASLVQRAEALRSDAARRLAADYATRYRKDAEALPLGALRDAIARHGLDPAALSQAFGVDLATVFRRIATLPDEAGAGPVGLAICDASGTLVFRKPIAGFALPQFGAACPLLPLYQALGRPMSPVRAIVEQAGRHSARFLTYAISQPGQPADFDGPVVFEATMLILPEPQPPQRQAQVIPIGPTCRVCPRDHCVARREPSILSASD
ncbi:helix-turn-helix domain-containing protein [Ovoidimarina sediminis]|uniref:helix-turn-helix domain-containing protein n=1 Tax=Ovoidimarina sediminis TaxID=3079856 RepID=UPI0029087A42|nr:short-chain fatty acyl-CoA regulator family protein [Rhodophyticola sp. MJ-SS7]MDU8946568.1 short-chain fatty acyl-CoA regulator family protein [Rhodophyticola sp. MJ-SS7]